MALKLDMSKAYDRVECVCLDKIMDKFGFDEKWRKPIMQCVITVTYSVKINGVLRGNIIPSRVIRQGDPLSPYLFYFLCKRYLSNDTGLSCKWSNGRCCYVSWWPKVITPFLCRRQFDLLQGFLQNVMPFKES